jgi:hypothetical protein
MAASLRREETDSVLSDLISGLLEISGDVVLEPLCRFVGELIGRGQPELPYDGCVNLGFITIAVFAGIVGLAWWLL